MREIRMDFLEDLSDTLDDGTPYHIDNFIAFLQGYKKTYPDATKLIIIREESYEGSGSYYKLYNERLETEQEEKSRLFHQEQWSERNEDRDRKEFERLKKKYEPTPEAPEPAVQAGPDNPTG